MGQLFGVAMGLASPPGEINSETVVLAFDGEGVSFALWVTLAGKNQPVGMPEVGAEGDVIGVRKRRIQAAGRFGATIAQRPAADFLGSTINSPPEPAGRFFWPT